MKENIDLTKILKDCPKGTVFWSDDYGEVKFLYVNTLLQNPIQMICTNGFTASYTKEGWHSINFPASCLLWPSKDCRNWSKFTAPWLKKERFDPKTLKAFDKVLVRDSCVNTWICTFYSHTREYGSTWRYITVDGTHRYCVPYNDDTKHLVGTKEEAPEFYRYWEG